MKTPIFNPKTAVLMLTALMTMSTANAQSEAPLMLVGEAVCCGWSASSSPVMVADESTPGVFHYTGWLEADKEFKFITHTDWSGDQYLNPNATDPYILGETILQRNGDDTKFKVSQSGNYDITANVEQLTLSVTRSPYQEKAVHYNILYLVGGNTPGGWSLNDATPLKQSNDNPFLFTATLRLTADGSFKVAVNCFADFAQKFYFRDATDDARVSEDTTDDRQWSVAEDGEYDVQIDIDAMTISIVKHTETAITAVPVTTSAPLRYTLSGMKANANAKGICIENGKKILVR